MTLFCGICGDELFMQENPIPDATPVCTDCADDLAPDEEWEWHEAERIH